ncbi:MAG TPA: phosphate ABC transporter permease subunit PstC [Thermodesulfobacteriota bacterium]|nr:phosphate ABC transporter permease subunit PstC [Thermodesulfobacteriota bacterium]
MQQSISKAYEKRDFQRINWRRIKDRMAGQSMFLAVSFANSIVLLIAVGLFLKSWPILAQKPILHLLLSSSWSPLRGKFGFYPFIIGTVEVTAIAMILSVPVCLLSAIYLSEYAHRRFRELTRFVIDLMAAIPSVIYGLWGVLVVVPFVSVLGQILGAATTGYSLLAGGIILAIMVSPIIISVSMEVLSAVPLQARETALALGATRWEGIKHVILKSASHGIFSAILLGFARAFGETIAVLMVVGNVARVPSSVFDPAYPLPALLANNYGEMMSIPLYDSALLLSALMLLLVAGFFSVTAHLTLLRVEKE